MLETKEHDRTSEKSVKWNRVKNLLERVQTNDYKQAHQTWLKSGGTQYETTKRQIKQNKAETKNTINEIKNNTLEGINNG